VTVLTGATASGKSAVAMALAERLGAEIVSVDSMQVYRGMDIGTGKPDAAAQRHVPHHLIDLRWPWESFSAQEFVQAATAAIADIRRRGRLPLVVGGTVLYIRALTEGLFAGPSADWTLRHALVAEAERRGVPALHRRLAQVDPQSAQTIHINDLRRIVRALEVFEKTGRPISEHQRQWAKRSHQRSANGIEYPTSKTQDALSRRLIILDRDRADLYGRINRRVEAMLAAGWLEETRRLVSDARGISRQAAQALGYRDLADHLAGRSSLAEAVDRIQRRTRHYARRQLIWFRRLTDAAWVRVAPDEPPSRTAERTAPLMAE
jgi:tRNA dimethylallyltransferase